MLTGNDWLPSPAASRPGLVVWPPSDFRPGDLLFFAGRDLESRAIALRTAGLRNLLAGRWFSHVGPCAEHKGETLLIESTTFCDEPCLLSGKRIAGVQAHLPAERVENYQGKVWRLRLRRPLDALESRHLSDFLLAQIGLPYNYRRAAELATFFARRIPEAPLPDAWFCDELAIEAFKVINRAGHDNDPERFSPGTFASLVLRSAAVWPIGDDPERSVRLK